MSDIKKEPTFLSKLKSWFGVFLSFALWTRVWGVLFLAEFLVPARYIREWADLYDVTVPDLVIFTVLSFYHYILFGDCHKCYRLSGKDNNTITKIAEHLSWENSAYAKQWILSTSNVIIKWEIKINENKQDGGLIMGLINNQHHHDVEDCAREIQQYLRWI